MNQHLNGIPAHGGHLINRIATPAERQEFIEKAESLPKIQLDKRALSDLEMIAIGGFSPLNGFMDKDDYESVVVDMRLKNGLPWSIPVTLSVSEEVADSIKEGSWVGLSSPEGEFAGVLELTQKFHYNKAHEAIN
ncbi:MAG: sulfate adenylyltransferase, partial [Trichodesmium sp. St11_bin5]|nr:sulfate adenylyltransferase [Trichodesmium sp. St11_bin5]